MFYVLRTSGDIDKHWGFTCVGTTHTKAKAIELAKEQLKKAPSNDRYVITKSLHLVLVTTYKIDEHEL